MIEAIQRRSAVQLWRADSQHMQEQLYLQRRSMGLISGLLIFPEVPSNRNRETA